MQVNHPDSSLFPPSPPGSAALKRPYAQRATDNQSNASPRAKMAYRAPHTHPEGGRQQRPAKTPKVEAAQASSSSSSRFRESNRGRYGLAFKPTRGSPLAGRPGGPMRGSSKTRHIPVLPEPRHDLNHISERIKTKPLRSDFEDNSKSPLSNYHVNHYGTGVTYDSTQYRSPASQSGLIYR